MATELERKERLLLLVEPELLSKIITAETLKEAGELVMTLEVDAAVSVIDNLDPLTAAFIVLELRRLTTLGSNYRQIRQRVAHARKILARAKELQTRGVNGLCYARDQVYRETGYFAGI